MVDHHDDEALDRALVKRFGFERFVKLAWSQVMPDELVWERHMSEVCAHIDAFIHGDITKLIINIPPGMSKSVLCNVFAPAYAWIVNPAFRMGFMSNERSLTNRDARRCRALIESEWFQARWSMKMMDDSNKIEEYTNEHGGSRSCHTIRQQITGHHWHMVFIDDPHDPANYKRGDGPEGVAEWFDHVLPTRFINKADSRIVIVMQRLADDDLVGHILENERDEWVHLCLPMEATDNPVKTPIGGDWRTTPSELLAPGRFPRDEVEKQKRKWPARIASAQYQQDPVPTDGNIFLAHYFDHRYKAIPDGAAIYLSFDMSFKDSVTSDFVVGTAWALAERKYHLVDMVRGRWGFTDTLRQTLLFTSRYPEYRGLLIEEAANGNAIIDALRKGGHGNKIIPVKTGRVSKEERAFAVTPLMENGAVLFPQNEPSWWTDFIQECLRFPAGKHDDIVDSVTQALLYLDTIRLPDMRKVMANARRVLHA